MPPNWDVFEIAGPVHLSSVNWSSPNDQRIILACLAQATAIIEIDRAQERTGEKALAPPWYNNFNFELKETLKDDFDSSIFGCIFEFKSSQNSDFNHQEAPRFVIAFRGTLFDSNHRFRDGLLDLSLSTGGINKSTRFEKSLVTVQNLISEFETSNIWLAGHSLGASIATVIGKYMAKMDLNIKTFLFNPPFASVPLDMIPNLDKKLKESLHILKTIIETGISILAKNHRNKSHENFSELEKWTPYLFVNPGDPISSSYIHYFENSKKMEKKKIGFLSKFEAGISIREVCSDLIGWNCELSHLLPSASLTVNLKKVSGWQEAHGIFQWWDQDIDLKYVDYHLNHDS